MLEHAGRRRSAPSAATSARRTSPSLDRDVLFRKVLANDAIEQVVAGPLTADHLARRLGRTRSSSSRAAARRSTTPGW